MGKPRVFISSTFSDLHETRNHVRDFISEYGYEPVAFEKNDITYEPNKSLEESCYEEVKDCSMFILLLKSNFGQPSNIKSIRGIKIPSDVKSVTQLEYLFARQIGIPIFVFVYKSSLDEFNSFKKQGFPKEFKFNYLDHINHALFIKELFEDKEDRYIFHFLTAENITQVLRKQWAGLFNKYLKNFQEYKIQENEKIYINSFKLFFFRRNFGISQQDLAAQSGLPVSKIQSLEDAGIKLSRIDTKDFKMLDLNDAQSIARVLNCHVGNIRAGLPDDYLTQYLSYYFRNKGVKNARKTKTNSLKIFKTKAIVFDFDGTLTKPKDGLTSWEKIWLKLGYDPNECGELHSKFSKTEITHKKWCQITEDKFKARALSKLHLNEIADEIKLLPGTFEVLKQLTEKDIKLYICSGSIDYLINRVLGNAKQYFDEIKSNKFHFTKSKKLHKIIGTRFDFEGKSDYLNQISIENDIEPYEILFIGNSLNDEWAHQSGALTLCVNPQLTNPDHPFQWTYSVRSMENLTKVLDFVN